MANILSSKIALHRALVRRRATGCEREMRREAEKNERARENERVWQWSRRELLNWKFAKNVVCLGDAEQPSANNSGFTSIVFI